MNPPDALQRHDRLTGVTPSGIAFDDVAASGTPIVLVHAGIADRRMWDPQWPQLTAARSAVPLDLRGFGWRGDVAQAELDPPALDRLSEIAARTLGLVGGHDLETTDDAAARVVAGIAGARRIDWPDVAHLPSLEHPQAFLDLLMERTAS